MQNFGKIKNVFNTILIEGIGKQDQVDKDLFKEYIKAVNENEILKTQFMVYTNIENRVDENEFKATQYVKENIALLDKFKKKDIVEANLNLARLIMFEQVDDYVYEEEALHENITKLIFTKKNGSNIDKIMESRSSVVKYINENTEKTLGEDSGIPNSVISSIAVDKYNEKYSELSEGEKKVLKTILESSDEDRTELFSSTIRECIDSIDTRLDESEIEEKDKLLRVKDKLMRMDYVKESFVTDICKLVDLKNDLK
jgi:hypothetical protein